MGRQGGEIGRGLVLGLASWVALAALYELALRGLLGVRHPVDWLAAAAGALSLRLALAAFAASSRAAEDRRLLAEGRDGALPRDGKRFAAAGVVTALTPGVAQATQQGAGPAGAPPLVAPFSGRPCLAYRYRIDVAAGEGTGSAPAYAGVALAPAVISAVSGGSTAGGTAPLPAGGAGVRLLGFPTLAEGFAETVLAGERALARAAAYVAATSFAELPSEEPALAADARGTLRRDWRSGGGGGLGVIPPSARLAETVLGEGDEVCAFGLYRAAEGGLAPDVSPGGKPLLLLRGGGGAAAAALARDGRRELWIGLAILLLPHAALAAFLLARGR